MEKYRVVVSDIFSGCIVVKMIVNRDQKIAIEHLYEHECFGKNLKLQIMPDEKWKELC